MVKKQMYYEIKKLQKLGYGKNRITRELGIDCNTIQMVNLKPDRVADFTGISNKSIY